MSNNTLTRDGVQHIAYYHVNSMLLAQTHKACPRALVYLTHDSMKTCLQFVDFNCFKPTNKKF